MSKIKSLDPKYFRQIIQSQQLKFTSTRSVKPLNEFIGQERAIDALIFGVDIQSPGYNLYAMGPTGLGKRSLVNKILAGYAHELSTPQDWCYIYNFNDPEQPIALPLPAGLGIKFQKDMNVFIEELGSVILTIFESDGYRAKMKKINDDYEAKRSANEKKKSHSKIDKTPQLYKEQHKKELALQISAITAPLKPIIRKLKIKYIKYRIILHYLTDVLNDVITHASEYIHQDSKTKLFAFLYDHVGLTKYKINLLVNHSKQKGAPVIFEEAPSYSTLISRVEYITKDGILETNFTLIKSGSLHQANGGYLIIEARKLVNNIEAWEALKSALYSEQIKIKIIEASSDAIKTVSLQPMPIPLKIKIILIGSRNTYYNLCQRDSDFTKLFKVPVDFNEQMDKTTKNIHLYARLIGTIAKKNNLLPFDRSAVAAIINNSSRMAEDVEKLSTYFGEIEDIIVQSSYWASVFDKKMVRASDVKWALDANNNRQSRSKELYYEDIQRDFIIIKTSGKTIGQVNCLSVRRVGNFAYGHPTRVTARVRAGKEKLIDIQREIKLAGPMHSKAGLIISNFLASRFSLNAPFSLHASLAFEQLYCWTDGDSASVGELCALLSAIAELPILQSLAVTGSIDQNGIVQAIGGVNEKIEGFFDVCQANGLSGKQGVVIPAVNIKNLMIREDIQQIAIKNKFHIYPVATIDEAITLMTGVKAGERDKHGNYPPGSVYFRVEEKLKKMAST